MANDQHNGFSAAAFSERLAFTLEQKQVSRSQLAAALGVSRSTVTGWLRHHKLPDAYLIHKLCAELGCSADWLLGLSAQVEKHDTSGNVRWLEQIPPFVTKAQREQIAYGIRLFNLLVTENRSADDVSSGTNAQTIRLALQAAIRSGAIRLTEVARNHQQEAALKEMYPSLKEVVVANVPQNYDDTIIRTELVCFLTAVDVLSQLIRPTAVGLGSGYTILRLCEQSMPTIDQFSGTAWVPLLAFAADNMTDYTATYLARLMSIRHPGSQALSLPHPDECVTPELAAVHQATLDRMKNLQTIFVSVSGVDRRDRAGSVHLLSEFRSADYLAEAPELRRTYAQLEQKGRFGAELLRILLDSDGEIIARDPAVGAQADLDILRYNSTIMGRVWIVAARRYKARAVLTCIRSHLANALVIDSEIAAELLSEACDPL